MSDRKVTQIQVQDTSFADCFLFHGDLRFFFFPKLIMGRSLGTKTELINALPKSVTSCTFCIRRLQKCGGLSVKRIIQLLLAITRWN